MTDGVESLGRIRAKGIALLAVTFIVGVLAGLAAERALASRRAPEFPPSGRPMMGGWRAGELPQMFRRLELTEEQRAQIETILERARPRTEAVLKEMMPRLHAAMDSVNQEIRLVLTPEQISKLDSIMEEMRSRRLRRRGRLGRPMGPGAPSLSEPH